MSLQIAPKLKPAVSSGSVHKQANYVQDDMVLLNNASRSSLFNQTITAARSVNDLGNTYLAFFFFYLLVASRSRQLYILYSSSFFLQSSREVFLMSKFSNFFGSQIVPFEVQNYVISLVSNSSQVAISFA